jgi:hypothetical protein
MEAIMNIKTSACFIGLLLLNVSAGVAQEKTITPDLSKIADGRIWKIENADVGLSDEQGKSIVHLKAKGVEVEDRSNTAFAWVVGVEFSEGIIDVDLKGRNKPQGSFLGVAFHGVDEKTFEAVYFRPFNFRAEGVFRTRAVQYIAWPAYPWKKLRAEQPGQYEQGINPPPDPDGWFHARIEVTKNKVHVFVDNATQPSLVVDRLVERQTGMIGLFVDIQDGTFANFKITPAK